MCTHFVQNDQTELLKHRYVAFVGLMGSNGAFSISSWHPFAAPYKWIHSHSARFHPARNKLLSEERRADKSPSYSRQHAAHFNYHTFPPSLRLSPPQRQREALWRHTPPERRRYMLFIHPYNMMVYSKCLKAKLSECLCTIRSGWVLMQRRIAYHILLKWTWLMLTSVSLKNKDGWIQWYSVLLTQCLQQGYNSLNLK